jgi:coenzyme PQQ biosynthesis protein PqqD
MNGVRLQTDSVTGKSVLLHPEGIIELNETAQAILSRCDGRTVDVIIRALAEEYDADPEAISADVYETLGDLHQKKLIAYA